MKMRWTFLGKWTIPCHIGEVLGGVLTPVEPKFAVAKDAKMVEELPCTDALMNMMSERLPEVVPATR